MKIRSALFALALAAAWAGAGSLVQQAPRKAQSLQNPLAGEAEAARAGEKLYARECAACHGGNLEGRGRNPALRRPDISAAAPGALFWVLRNGSLRHRMPSFAHLPEAQRWQIVTFLQSGR